MRAGRGTRAEARSALRRSPRREQLEERHRREPPPPRLVIQKHSLSLEAQVGHLGPVWFDQVRRPELAPYGFGSEVARALEGRRLALRALGVQLDDPDKDAKRREIERRAVGEGIAARKGQRFLVRSGTVSP